MASIDARILGENEHDVVRAIADETYAYLLTNPLRIGSSLEPTGSPLEIGRARLCPEASDVVTRTAQQMGLVATREYTSRYGRGHVYTSSHR